VRAVDLGGEAETLPPYSGLFSESRFDEGTLSIFEIVSGAA
jgi:hypothetical protein